MDDSFPANIIASPASNGASLFLRGRETESETVLRYAARFITGATSSVLGVVGACGIGKSKSMKQLVEALQTQEGVAAYQKLVKPRKSDDSCDGAKKEDAEDNENEEEEEEEGNDSKQALLPEFKYINCASMEPKQFVVDVIQKLDSANKTASISMTLPKLVEQVKQILAKKNESNNNNNNAVLSKAQKQQRNRKGAAAAAAAARRFTFLILDEIDTVSTSSSNSGGTNKIVSQVAKLFFEIRSAGIILISNNLDLSKLLHLPTDRLEYLTFLPYSTATLKHIAQSKHGAAVLSGAALQVAVSSTVQSYGGDVRKLLDIVDTAVEKKKSTNSAAASNNNNNNNNDNSNSAGKKKPALRERDPNQSSAAAAAMTTRQQQAATLHKRDRDDVDNKLSAGEVAAVVQNSTDLSVLDCEGLQCLPQHVIVVLGCVLVLYDAKYKQYEEGQLRLSNVHNGFSTTGAKKQQQQQQQQQQRGKNSNSKSLSITVQVDEVHKMTQKLYLQMDQSVVANHMSTLHDAAVLGCDQSKYWLMHDSVTLKALVERNLDEGALNTFKRAQEHVQAAMTRPQVW